MKRTLVLKKESLAELTTDELSSIVGAGGVGVSFTFPLDQCPATFTGCPTQSSCC